MRQTLPKSNILRGYQSFTTVITNGVSFKGTLLSAFVLKDMKRKSISVGFSVSKKRVALAVNRNRTKRLIREAVRRNFIKMRIATENKNIGADIVVMYKGDKHQDIHRLKFQDIEQEWITLQEQILRTL